MSIPCYFSSVQSSSSSSFFSSFSSATSSSWPVSSSSSLSPAVASSATLLECVVVPFLRSTHTELQQYGMMKESQRRRGRNREDREHEE